jgi:hypothetical protein
VRLFAIGSDTIVQTASSCTEATNRKGTYAAVFTDPGAAEFELVALSSGVAVCRWFCTLTLTTATFQAYDGPAKLAAITHTGARVPNVTLVDTTTTNTDMRGTDNAALASAWTATRAGYLDGVLLAQNANQRTVQVTGSNHVASDVHAFQTDVIDAAAIAASAVTKLQAGLATAQNLLIVSDRVSYGLAVLVGACSDAQTAAETYTLSIGGNTFTVDYSGLDASGNRSTTTLSKT